MSDTHLYEGREQTLVKHLILGKYLERFAIIIGFNWASITYVDCFSGTVEVSLGRTQGYLVLDCIGGVEEGA